MRQSGAGSLARLQMREGRSMDADPQAGRRRFRDQRVALLAGLRELGDLAARLGARSCSERLLTVDVPRLETECFRLLLVGESGAGKTSLVNALLGADLLPTVPTRVALHVRHGEEAAAEIVWAPPSHGGAAGPRRQVIPLEALGSRTASPDEIAGIAHLEVRYPGAFVDDGLIVVDTPGVAEGSSASQFADDLLHVDAVALVLDARRVLDGHQSPLLGDPLLAAADARLFVLLNKRDLLSEDQGQAVLEQVRGALRGRVDDVQVLLVGANPAGAEQSEATSAASGLGAFEAALTDWLTLGRGPLLIADGVSRGLGAVAVLRSCAEAQRRALFVDEHELAHRCAVLAAQVERSAAACGEQALRVREVVAATKALARRDIESFGANFAAALPAQIDASDGGDLRRFLPPFIDEKFRDLAAATVDRIAPRLDEIAEAANAFAAENARAQTEGVEDLLGPATADLKLGVDTFAQDVGVFALGAVGLTIMAFANVLAGGALTLAAPALAYVFRERAERALVAKSRHEVPLLVIASARRMADVFDARIDAFGERLLAFVEGNHQEVARSLLEVVSAAQAARFGDRERRLDFERAIDAVRASLPGLEARIVVVRDRALGPSTG